MSVGTKRIVQFNFQKKKKNLYRDSEVWILYFKSLKKYK